MRQEIGRRHQEGIERLTLARSSWWHDAHLSITSATRRLPGIPNHTICWTIHRSWVRNDKVYVVQTNTKVVQRCMLMTTDPGDLVLDPTCGSGTTAYVAEQWGRRWITCDTSRVAITLAKQRLMTAFSTTTSWPST